MFLGKWIGHFGKHHIIWDRAEWMGGKR